MARSHYDSTMKAEDVLIEDSAVCFLLVNKIEILPNMSIQSCIDNCDLPIFIGYTNESDLLDLPTSDQLRFIKLDPKTIGLDSLDTAYVDFSNPHFFRLVALKWLLFLELFRQGYKQIIYSDLDVLWFKEVHLALRAGHQMRPNILVQVQSATNDISSPRLCMGLISMVNDPSVILMVEECFSNHLTLLAENPFTGDDDVITNFYRDSGFPYWISELPQSTYPVGNMANLFARRNFFPGLRPFDPMIFHGNYLIGNKRKVLVLNKVLSTRKQERLAIMVAISILGLRLRLLLGNLKRKLHKHFFDNPQKS